MNFSWNYLTTPMQKPDPIWPYFVFFALSMVASIVLHIATDKKKMPKFQKRFIRKISDFLLYIPTLFQFILLAIYAGIKSFSLPIYLFILGVIWLIWFFFLIYYRLVILREFWKLYLKQQEEEKYIHGKGKTSSAE